MPTFYEIVVHMPDKVDCYGGPNNCTSYPVNYSLYCYYDYPKVLQEELMVRIEKGWYELNLISQQEGFNTKVIKEFRNLEEFFEEIYPQKKLEALEKKRIKLEEDMKKEREILDKEIEEAKYLVSNFGQDY